MSRFESFLTGLAIVPFFIVLIVALFVGVHHA